MRDVELLRSKNLVLGGSLDNAVVVDDHRVLYEDGLRYEDENDDSEYEIYNDIGDMIEFLPPPTKAILNFDRDFLFYRKF